MAPKTLPPDTPEQALITQYKGAKLVVIAFAGTGKTTTLIKYALNNPKLRILYIAYNRAIRDEAAAKFPANVECKTSHQIAYAVFGKKYRHKQRNNLRLLDVSAALDSRNWEMIKDVVSTLNNFLSSADETILTGHTPHGDQPESLNEDQHAYKAALVQRAKQIWALMVDVDTPFPMTHDGYLKLFQLSKPVLAHRYSAILFDEAQDANPVTTDIVLRQPCIVIFVGDRHQQIYRFRGADNALDTAQMDDAQRLYLTNSFRFGPRVAMVANAILSFKGEDRKVIGRGKEDVVSMSLPAKVNHRCILHRTVMATIATAIGAAQAGKKIYWIGGMEGYQVESVEDLHWLAAGEKDKIKSPSMKKEFSTFDAYANMAKATGNGEMRRALTLIDNYSDLPNQLNVLRQMTVEDESEAQITVGTAHRSKGLEWNYVALADDFPDIFAMQTDQDSVADELNLLYVACTRAMKHLAINATVESILRYQFAKAHETA